jgi:hypothetical protein
MGRPLGGAAALLLASSLAGCKGPAERLVDLRRDALAEEDALYRAYGGSDVANAVHDAARRAGAGSGLGDLLANAARDADREAFLADCMRLGSGERPVALSDKARTFYAAPSTQQGCRRLVTLRGDIAALELEEARAR